MQTSNVFHAPRFGAYFKKHIIDNMRLYLMSLFVLTGLMVAVGLFRLLVSPESIEISSVIPFYFILLFGTGLIFSSLSFIQLADKSKGTDYLLLPASHLEKFLTTLLITTVGFWLVFHIAFGVASLLNVALLSLNKNVHLINDLPNHFSDTVALCYHWWFMGQAIILLGAIYFPRFSLVRTLLAVFIFVLLMWVLNVVITNIFFYGHIVNWGSSAPFFGVMVTDNSTSVPMNNAVFLESPKWMLDTLYFLWRFILPPALWVLAFFRLKDIEI